jgi:DNA-binding XRE family transcriptional regulator
MQGPQSTGSPDVYFGEKLKALRRTVVPKLTQEELAKALGLSFQHKYEQGKSRMSAAMMVRIAALLNVDVHYFFDELQIGVMINKEIKTPVLTGMSNAAHGPRLIDAFLKLKSDQLRGAAADLAEALVRAA